MPRALISIGTNSTRLLIVECDAVVLHEVRGTRIGEGLREGGPLEPHAAARTLHAVREFAGIARSRDASIAGIATSALRRADDAEAFVEKFREATGASLRIISGDEEAGYSFIGAVRGLHLHGAVGVLDVGGGSSEYAYGDEEGAQATVSCEIGAVRLTERVPELGGERGAGTAMAIERARAFAREALEPIRGMRHPKSLIAVGGSVAAAAALVTKNDDREALTGTVLRRDDLEHLLDEIVRLDLRQRRAVPHMIAQRADILPAGIIVVSTVMSIVECDETRFSSLDLLYGYLMSHPDGEP